MDDVELTDEEQRLVDGVIEEFGVSRARAVEVVLIGTRGRWADDVIDEPLPATPTT